MEKIWNALQKAADIFKDWIIEHQSNPLLWIGIVLLGMAVFFMTYNALQKEK